MSQIYDPELVHHSLQSQGFVFEKGFKAQDDPLIKTASQNHFNLREAGAERIVTKQHDEGSYRLLPVDGRVSGINDDFAAEYQLGAQLISILELEPQALDDMRTPAVIRYQWYEGDVGVDWHRDDATHLVGSAIAFLHLSNDAERITEIEGHAPIISEAGDLLLLALPQTYPDSAPLHRVHWQSSGGDYAAALAVFRRTVSVDELYYSDVRQFGDDLVE